MLSARTAFVNTKDPLRYFPSDLWWKIVDPLGIVDIQAASRVCREWRRLFHLVGRRLLQKYLPLAKIECERPLLVLFSAVIRLPKTRIMTYDLPEATTLRTDLPRGDRMEVRWFPEPISQTIMYEKNNARFASRIITLDILHSLPFPGRYQMTTRDIWSVVQNEAGYELYRNILRIEVLAVRPNDNREPIDFEIRLDSKQVMTLEGIFSRIIVGESYASGRTEMAVLSFKDTSRKVQQIQWLQLEGTTAKVTDRLDLLEGRIEGAFLIAEKAGERCVTKIHTWGMDVQFHDTDSGDELVDIPTSHESKKEYQHEPISVEAGVLQAYRSLENIPIEHPGDEQLRGPSFSLVHLGSNLLTDNPFQEDLLKEEQGVPIPNPGPYSGPHPGYYGHAALYYNP